MNVRSGFAGLDLTPLPFESEISSLMRIGWRNAFRATEMRAHFSATQKVFWLDGARLESELKWTALAGRPGPFRKYGACAFTAYHFRYCPLCLEHGYHSYLHQCLEIISCPIHHVPLSNLCHCCDCITHPINDYDGMLERPYFCIYCRGPISGTSPKLDLHLDFRAVSESVAEAMSPYDEWWKEGIALREWASALAVNHQSTKPFRWCDERSFLRSLAHQAKYELSELERPRFHHEIVTLRWRQRVARGGGSEPKRLCWVKKSGTHRTVYRATLRLLERWIDREFLLEVARIKATNADPVTWDYSSYSLRKTALSMMRTQLEEPTICSSGGWIKVKYDDGPAMAMVNKGRTSRLAWRAYFLALYASWYRVVSQKTSLQAARMMRFPKSAAAMVFFHSTVAYGCGDNDSAPASVCSGPVFLTGGVAFFRVPGMPTAPWRLDAP